MGDPRLDAAPLRPSRFEDTVPHYVAHRLRYHPRLIARLVAEVGLGPDSAVLDLGCGPGLVAHALAPHVGRVLGLDPNARMLDAARAEAAALGLSNVGHALGSSEELSAAQGPFDAVVMGRAFHWMDREATLRALDGLVAPGGAVALLGDRAVAGPANAWWRRAMTAAEAHAARDAHAEHRRSEAWAPHEAVLLGSPFSRVDRVGVVAAHEWSWEALSGLLASRSTTTREGLGEVGFEAMLADVRAAIGDEGPWRSIHEHTGVIGRRAAAR